MSKPACHRSKAECCAIADYWRELADAEQACNHLLREERDGLQQIVDHLRLALRERDKEIVSLSKRKKAASAKYAYSKAEPIRRSA